MLKSPTCYFYYDWCINVRKYKKTNVKKILSPMKNYNSDWGIRTNESRGEQYGQRCEQNNNKIQKAPATKMGGTCVEIEKI